MSEHSEIEKLAFWDEETGVRRETKLAVNARRNYSNLLVDAGIDTIEG